MKKNDFLPYLFLSGGGGGDDYALFGLFCVRSLPSTGHGQWLLALLLITHLHNKAHRHRWTKKFTSVRHPASPQWTAPVVAAAGRRRTRTTKPSERPHSRPGSC